MRSAFAAACALAASSLACAQSNVTIFGTVDLFVAHARSGSTSWTKLSDGGNAASRIGFRGSEDLGGGLEAHFMLEGGFSPDTGEGNLPGPAISFTRQSYVGLTGPWGQIDAGRMYTPLFFTLFRGDPYGVNSVFSPLVAVFSNDAQPGALPLAARASNMIRYRTPARSEFFADIAYAPSEASEPSRRSGDLYGASVGWARKPYYVSYAIQKARSGSAAAPVASPSTTTHQAVSGSYEFSNLRVYGTYSTASTDLPGVPRSRAASLGAQYTITPASNVLFEIVQRKVRGTDRAQLAWTLGYDHYLSKRTAVYGRLLRLENRGRSSVSLAGVRVDANSGNDVRVIAAGIRHTF
ncbi:porin [Xenophilus sp.]|uniref:porin n=1 Tax=Xenophilus sp. TaxID=1873499 RepID=UPI0037DD9DC2